MSKRQTTPDATPSTQSYRVLRDGYVAGRPRKAGDTVELTEAEAKYENLAPAGKTVAPAAKGTAAT